MIWKSDFSAYEISYATEVGTRGGCRDEGRWVCARIPRDARRESWRRSEQLGQIVRRRPTTTWTQSHKHSSATTFTIVLYFLVGYLDNHYIFLYRDKEIAIHLPQDAYQNFQNMILLGLIVVSNLIKQCN